MVLEIAMLTVVPGREAEFEASFREAEEIIAATDGFVSLDLHRSIEITNRYALQVVWEKVEDHTEGFRGSPAYEEWKRLLHRFYDPLPVVGHYRRVTAVQGGSQ